MPRVSFTPHLRRFFPNLDECDVDAATVRAVVDELERRHPGLASYIVDETGRLRRHVNIFVGDEPIYDRANLSDAVAADGRVFIAQALSGG
jgi:sulfur-carrier protein